MRFSPKFVVPLLLGLALPLAVSACLTETGDPSEEPTGEVSAPLQCPGQTSNGGQCVYCDPVPGGWNCNGSFQGGGPGSQPPPPTWVGSGGVSISPASTAYCPAKPDCGDAGADSGKDSGKSAPTPSGSASASSSAH